MEIKMREASTLPTLPKTAKIVLPQTGPFFVFYAEYTEFLYYRPH